jgi:hypothetical protein
VAKAGITIGTIPIRQARAFSILKSRVRIKESAKKSISMAKATEKDPAHRNIMRINPIDSSSNDSANGVLDPLLRLLTVVTESITTIARKRTVDIDGRYDLLASSSWVFA